MLRGIVRTPLRLLLLLLLVVLPQHVQLFATAQVLSAQFTPCLRSASQAPPDQLLNISRVYAQWDNGQQSPGQMVGGGMNAEDNANGQALLRLVALAETGVQSEGFSNETNYLATLIVETSILSFIPYSNQSSLCSSIITAGESLVSENNNISALSFPNPGGCPYGPGPVLIGYEIPLGSIGLDDYYPLSTLSTRLRILDTSVPPLQLACVDVYTTPSYTATSAEGVSDASDTVFTLLLWLPVAVLIAYIVANVIARFYASWSTVKRDREAAIAASLNDAKAAASRSFVAQARSVMLEFAVGRSIVRSRSLTRFATPGVGDVLGTFQWIAMVGMCSVIWQGFAYPIFSRLGWSMLVFNTTILTPTEDHTDPTYSSDRYPPSVFQFNSEDLFTDQNSPFYFSQRQVHSNLLNIPSTGRYNSTRVTSAEFYPSENELQGLASFSAILGFRPQDLFANSTIFFAFLLAATVLFTFILPVALVTILRAVRGKPKAGSGLYASPTAGEGHSRSSSRDDGVDGPVGDLTAIQLAKHRFNALTGGSGSGNGRGSRGADTTVSEDTGERSFAKISGKHLGSDEPFGGPDSPAAHTGYLESLRSPSRQQHGQSGHRQGINRWWAGGDKEQRHAAQAQQDAYYEGNDSASTSDVHRSSAVLYSVASWYSFCLGSIARLLLFFHLPITIFSVYTMSHANRTSSAIEVAFATIVFLVFSIGLPIFFVLRIRRTMTRYLQDDTNTLLAYGPLYNTFVQDSYTFSAVRFTANLVEACVVGGSQNRATVQAAVILAVEIIETLITSIWLPWGEGAAQGPLQFIMSVTRIITAVLLIVISPAVRMSFTARGWIGYVIILVQALVVVLLLLVLVCKLVELVFRLIGRVEFDESRNPKAGGLLGAFRKKGVLGFKRRNTQRHRRPKNRSGDSGQRTHYPQQQRKSGLGYDESQQTSTAVQGGPRPSQATYRSHRSQVFFGDGDGYFNASVPVQPQQQRRPMRYLQEHDEDDEYIMSAFRSRPASMGHAHDGFADPGYVAPGSYSAPPGHQGPPIPSPTSPGSVGSGGGGAGAGVFQVIRGGRATDQSPYALAGSAGTREQNMSLPPGAAGYPSGAAGTAPGVQMGDRDVTDRNRPGQHRARAASQSAVVEFFNTDGEVSPGVTSLTSGEQYAQPYRNTGAAYFAHGASGAATNGVSAAERESRRLSAPLPTSPMSASRPSSSRRPMSMGGDGAVPPLAWRTSSSNAVGTASGSGHGHGQHQGSSSGHGNGFFTSLFKGGSRTGKEGDDWTDSDDSDDDEGRGTGGKKGKRRWPFVSSRGKQQRVGRTSATEGERVPLETMRGEDEEQEALDEEAAWAAAGTDGEGDDDADGETSAPTTGKSFVVIRKPMNQNQPR